MKNLPDFSIKSGKVSYFFSVENPAGFWIKSKTSFSYKKHLCMVFFLVLETLPVFGSDRKKSETLIQCAYRWSFLVLKILPVFRSSRKLIFLKKTPIYGIFFSVEKPAGFFDQIERNPTKLYFCDLIHSVLKL